MLGNFCLAFLYLCLNSLRICLTTGFSSDFVMLFETYFFFI